MAVLDTNHLASMSRSYAAESNQPLTTTERLPSASDVRQHHIDVCISRPQFFDNVAYLRGVVAPSKLCVVLKSNAYGHGLAPLTPVAIAAGADYLGICTNPEAATIRRLGFDVPILRLRMGLPDELEEGVRELDIEEEIGTLEQARYLAGLGQLFGRDVRVHLNIDTGMGRSGFFTENLDEIRRACDLSGLRVVGVFTHFPTADSSDLTATNESIELFEQCYRALRNHLPNDVLLHTHNSAATVRLTDRRFQMVRVDAACFGVRTSQEFDNPRELKPVMSIKVAPAAGSRSACRQNHRLRWSVHDPASQPHRFASRWLRRGLSSLSSTKESY